MERKTQSLADCEIKIDSATGTFSGYASVFNGVDSYGDTILPGAYADTLATMWPKMFLNHDSDELPIGKWLEIKEDSTGLYVTGEFTPGLADAVDVYAALKHGTVDGLSIGYVLQPDGYSQQLDEAGNPGYGRVISKVARLVEISVVTFPADGSARIDNVKSEIEKLETVRDFERFLRDVGGLSKSASGALIAQAKSIFVGDRQEIEIAKLTARINQITQKF